MESMVFITNNYHCTYFCTLVKYSDLQRKIFGSVLFAYTLIKSRDLIFGEDI